MASTSRVAEHYGRASVVEAVRQAVAEAGLPMFGVGAGLGGTNTLATLTDRMVGHR